MVARIFVVPMTAMACFVAQWAYNPAYLLVVAFDIVFAGVLVPLLAAVYYPKASPNAGACGDHTAPCVVLYTLPKSAVTIVSNLKHWAHLVLLFHVSPRESKCKLNCMRKYNT